MSSSTSLIDAALLLAVCMLVYGVAIGRALTVVPKDEVVLFG